MYLWLYGYLNKLSCNALCLRGVVCWCLVCFLLAVAVGELKRSNSLAWILRIGKCDVVVGVVGLWSLL